MSYGSHFFQDLVESGIFYVAILDGQRDAVFNPEQVLRRDNLLARVEPRAESLTDVIHVVSAPDLELYSDAVTQRLVCQ